MADKEIHLMGVIRLARDNISSLMNAYPDRYPRHAFQGTYDALDAALVGTPTNQPTLFATEIS